jgi:hypothetical protein
MATTKNIKIIFFICNNKKMELDGFFLLFLKKKKNGDQFCY